MPLIIPQIETLILETIHVKSEQLKCTIHGINTVEDHIHIAVTIPPSKSIWQWVRDVKGRSAYLVNQEFPDRDEIFKWQRGYSVHTFGKKTLPFILAYIENQKEHHRSGNTEPYLEHISD